MGRHELVRQRRRTPPLVAAAVAGIAVFLAVGASARPAAVEEAAPVLDAVVSCCAVVTAAPAGYSAGETSSALVAAPAQLAASRWRVIAVPRLMPAGVAPERGLQVKTILVARSISVVFPEIRSIGGVRPDALRWHPDGLALDVMIPNPGSAEGIRLGNEIVAYALANAARFGLLDAIWRGVYYTPGGPRSSVAGHFDHVHLTTIGGGYPTGRELYYR